MRQALELVLLEEVVQVEAQQLEDDNEVLAEDEVVPDADDIVLV